jgi:hypothetical protein
MPIAEGRPDFLVQRSIGPLLANVVLLVSGDVPAVRVAGILLELSRSYRLLAEAELEHDASEGGQPDRERAP